MKVKIPKLIRLTSPRWVEKIESREDFFELKEQCYIKGKRLNINDWECCIVGETLDLLDTKYNVFEKEKLLEGLDVELDEIETSFHKGCKSCVDFSRLFHSNITFDRDIEEFEESLKNFNKHLRLKHKDIVKKALAKDNKKK